MSKILFYADAESIEVLRSGRSKAVMLGSDFGYGNFGDVLQHVGTASRLRETTSRDLVSIFALEAISRFVSAAALRQVYKVDALAFVASEPLSREDLARLGLQQVLVVRNVSLIHLYGGGFLNEMWGDFSLQIAELLLQRLPSAVYVISGQQVSSGYSPRVAEHIEKFKPLLVGVRDRDSLRNVQEHGVAAVFSFDDAVEQLLSLSRLFRVERGAGAFIHLNSSGYTGNDSALSEMTQHLALVADRVGQAELPVLFQAFQDGREEVVDSIETVKRLERAFPFAGTQTELLVEAILAPQNKWSQRVLRGEFGYSCSYHITMWLQLNGVPCWLRGSNGYYDQKRRSLGVQGSFETFLETLPKVDHGANLEARSAWLHRLDAVVGGAGDLQNRAEWEAVSDGSREFYFKGEPRLETRLGTMWCEVRKQQEERGRLLEDLERLKSEARAEYERRSALEDAFGRNSQELEIAQMECASLKEKAGSAEAQRDAIEKELHAARIEREALISNAEAAVVQREVMEYELAAAQAAQVEAQATLIRLFDESQSVSARIASVQFVHEYVKDQQAILESRLLACSEQLTAVGHEARRYRQEAEAEHDARISLSIREYEANNKLGDVLASRSWRWTRPLRAFNRFVATRRFDAKGDVGLFEAVRLVGSRLPIPRSWKSQLGNWLRRMRRR
ncbi:MULTISPECIES: hypothetical protein [Stenotrophomonas]|uniref:hypothetical protein n=1 Tax=Stenotrophomonas TaxID=40323 RepID=UPI000770533F|nr:MULTISPECIES: hypothetical protein [Stenotrophomonas]AMJ57780.1 hypothetical protein AXG53_14935 [Stenotrophomonas sp. KCTC 12332]